MSRVMAQEAASEEVANRKLRCILGPNQASGSANIAMSDSVIFYKQISRRSDIISATILDIDETGVTLKFQSRTF